MSQGQKCITCESGQLLVRFPHDQGITSYLKIIARVHQAEAYFNPRTKLWRFPPRAAADLAHLEGFEIDPQAARLIAEAKARAGQVQPLEQRIAALQLNLDAPLSDGRTLYAHQKEGVRWLLQRLKGILADEMGVGKTLQALLASKLIYDAAKIPSIIVTKAGLIATWQAEARAVRHQGFSVHSWAKIPEAPNGRSCVLICDEAHYAQNFTSQRTKAILKLSEQAIAIFHLSGTPMKNGRPVNLFPLLKSIGHPLTANKRDYEVRYCGGHTQQIRLKGGRSRWVWWSNGATNEKELFGQVAPFILRRTKADCLDLPEKTVVLRDVDTNPEMTAEYDRVYQVAKARYKDRVRRGLVKEEGEALALLTMVRKAASLAKVPAAIELAEEALEEGEQAIVFSEYIDTVRRIAAHFNAPAYLGETPLPRRTEIVNAFQAGEQKVFAATRESAGVGLTLTAANVVVMVDRPFTPGDADQAADRAHRIGQHWPVSVYWLRAFDVCYEIDSLLQAKAKVIQQVLGFESQTPGGEPIKASQVLQLIFKLP